MSKGLHDSFRQVKKVLLDGVGVPRGYGVVVFGSF